MIEVLEVNCFGIKVWLCDEEGKFCCFFNFYVNEEDICFLEGMDIVLSVGDEVSIVFVVVGG